MTKMRRFVLLVQVLVCAPLILSTLLPTPTFAQLTENDSTSPNVRWAAPFEEQTSIPVAPADSQATVLANGEDFVVVIGGAVSAPGDARLTALEALGGNMGTIITVDAGTGTGQQYWLDLLVVGTTPYGAFTLARTNGSTMTLTLFMGPVSTFADGLAVAQQVVFVDDELLLTGVDPLALQALTETRLPELNSASESDDASGQVPSQTPTSPAAPSPTPDESGRVGEGMYVSPHHGFTLSWTDEWILDPQYEEPVSSDVNFDVDRVFLTVNSPQWVWFNFLAGPTMGRPLEEQLAWLTSSERLAVEIGEGAEVVSSRIGVNAGGDDAVAVITRWTTPEGYDLLIHEEWRLSDDGSSAAGLIVIMLVDDVPAGLRAIEAVTFEGGPVITLFTHDEILALIREERSI